MQCHKTHLLSLSCPLSSSFTNPLLSPINKHDTISFPRPTHSRRQLSISAAATVVDHGMQKSANTMYETLAVAESAGPEEIKAAYRKQARRWHPDMWRSPDEKAYFSQQFMKAREAYRVLSDPVLREDYDFSLKTSLGCGSVGGDALAGVMFRTGKRGGDRWGFADWELQLDELMRRGNSSTMSSACSSSSSSSSSSWGSRMRAMNASNSRPVD